jgi:hypothetical protein
MLHPTESLAPATRDPDITLSRHPGTEFALGPGRVHAIDIVDCPRLERVDLRALAPGAHVRLWDCPGLREVQLPEDAGATTVHIHSPRAIADLRLRGRVRDLTVATPEGAVQLPEAGAAPRVLRDGWIGRGNLPPDAFARAPELVVRLGAGGAEERMVDAGTVLAVIAGDPDLLRLRWDEGGHPALLAVEHCPRLQIVDCRAPVDAIRATHCPTLREVLGGGGVLSLVRSADVPRLEARGAWRELHLLESGARRLDFGFVDSLDLRNVEELHHVEGLFCGETAVRGASRLCQVPGRLDFSADPESLARNVAALHAYPDEVLEAAILSAVRARPPAKVRGALGLLAMLTPARLAPARAWALRETLRRPPVNRPDPGWRWCFEGSDLVDRGRFADLDLWLACRDTVPEAAAWSRHFATVHDTSRLRALIEWTSRRPAAAAAALDSCLVRALRGLPPAAGSPRTSAPALEQDGQAILRALRVRTPLSGTAALLDALAAALEQGWVGSGSGDLLAAMLLLGYLPARERLRRLGADPRFAESDRRRAIFAALAEPRSRALDLSSPAVEQPAAAPSAGVAAAPPPNPQQALFPEDPA